MFERILTDAGAGGGTVGQQVDSLSAESLLSSGALLGVRNDAAFRTNVGMLNPSAGGAPVTLTLRRSPDTVLGTASLFLPPFGYTQRNLRSSVSGRVDPGGRVPLDRDRWRRSLGVRVRFGHRQRRRTTRRSIRNCPDGTPGGPTLRLRRISSPRRLLPFPGGTAGEARRRAARPEGLDRDPRIQRRPLPPGGPRLDRGADLSPTGSSSSATTRRPTRPPRSAGASSSRSRVPATTAIRSTSARTATSTSAPSCRGASTS